MFQIPAVIGQRYGSQQDGPVAFILNVTRAHFSDLRKLSNRVAARAGVEHVTVTGTSAAVPLRVPRKASSQQLALSLAAHAYHHPGLLSDEARRMAFGLPTATHSLDAVTPGLPQGAFYGALEEGEPITIIAVLTVLIPVIVTIAAIVLPPLLAMAMDKLRPPDPVAEVTVNGDDVGTDAPEWIAGVPNEYLMVGGAAVALLLVLR